MVEVGRFTKRESRPDTEYLSEGWPVLWYTEDFVEASRISLLIKSREEDRVCSLLNSYMTSASRHLESASTRRCSSMYRVASRTNDTDPRWTPKRATSSAST